ncbi:MAG: diguanylate cyclase [Oscillospiraceae bacterium]|nr:diguanylate cyclase [Oscillospiraceae bacterium]
MQKKTQTLLFRFGSLFGIFSIVAILISVFAAYVTQSRIYREQQERTIHSIADYMAVVLSVDGLDFPMYQNYVIENHDSLDIPADFTSEDVQLVRGDYETAFARTYPGMILGDDVDFSELSDELKAAYAIYNHEYYLELFEKASELFNTGRVYYLVPTGEGRVMYCVLDPSRETRGENGEFLDLCRELDEPVKEHSKMWEAWDSGAAPGGFDRFDSGRGRICAWYTPLYIDGVKLGVIGAEVEISDFNRAIAANTLRRFIPITLILLCGVAAVLWLVNRFYISRIRKLTGHVEEYTLTKNARIAGEIESDMSRNDEISVLSKQTSSMILELDNYFKDLMQTTRELSDTKKQADAFSRLARRDALTGIRNRTAYEEEVIRLDRQLKNGGKAFGIAVIDLNDLKRINDTYGHEQGNIAIKKCCRLICSVFAHSPVFRIGGDEFAVILENEDHVNAHGLIKRFSDELEKQLHDSAASAWEQYSAAIGYASYDPSGDGGVSDVFRRADKAMYSRKNEMKNRDS